MNTVCLNKKNDTISSIKCKTNAKRKFSQSILHTFFSDTTRTKIITNDNVNVNEFILLKDITSKYEVINTLHTLEELKTDTKTPTKKCCDNDVSDSKFDHRSSDLESISKENNSISVHVDSNDRVSAVHHTELFKDTGPADMLPQNDLNQNSSFNSTSSDQIVEEEEMECKIGTIRDSLERQRKDFSLHSVTIDKTTAHEGIITFDIDALADTKHVSFDDDSCKKYQVSTQQKELTDSICIKENIINDTKEEVLECSDHQVVVSNTTKKTIKTKPKVFEQLYLDLGQKDFGKQIICPICGMLYIHGLIDDTKQHDNICIQYQQGVNFVIQQPKQGGSNKNNASQPRIVDQFSCKMSSIERSSKINQGLKKIKRQVSTTNTLKAYIVEIRQSDSNHCLKKLQDVISIAKQDIGFIGEGSSSHSDILPKNSICMEVDIPYTAYICVYNNRVIGLVIVEEIKVAYPLMKDDTQQQTTANSECDNVNQKCINTSSLSRSLHAQPVMLGIYLLWVHKKYRSMGIAKKLIDIARDRMFYGLHIPIDKIAFSSPTQAGLSFAMKYCCNNSETVSSKDKNNSQEQIQVANDDEASCVLVYDCGVRNRELFQLN